MPQERTNYEKLQECSQQVSELIELEELHRVGKVPCNAHELEIPNEMMESLKRRFIATRSKLIIKLNTIQA